MWALAVVSGATEFQVATRLRLANTEVFLPYTVEKQKTLIRARGRALYKVTKIQVARWPRYLFCKNEDLGKITADRDISYLVKGAEGLPALVSDEAMNRIRRGCDASGLVVRPSELHGFSVGDLLRFVASSNLAGHAARVLSIGDNGTLRVLVDNTLKATVDCKDLAA